MSQRIGTGLLASAIGAVWLVKIMGMQGATLEKVQPLVWQQMPLFTLPKSDPLAVAVRDEYLKAWETKGAAEVNQGIWMQSDMAVLADHQGTVPLPAASLTKIATTLAALNKWGPDHLFETLVSATGPIENGVLKGDLVISGSGDPLFVWEEAIAVNFSLFLTHVSRRS
ncbi:MAG TPA: hypothetical protein DC064_30295 [Cyanobacteria bacterium UBA9273]|nr:hypothetical protein [Cyanobacteria bacterium UBA9273]